MSSSLIVAALFSLTPRTGIGRAENNAPHKLLGTPLPNPKIVINKDERRLYLYSSSQMVRSYPIGLGSEPAGDKLRHGDGRTPEGQYYICVKNPNSKYYLSLGLSYPNVEDAQRGLRAGLISAQQHGRIVQAITEGKTPSWDTPLGGEIFIHGRGSAGDWTRGCIALDDKDIRELYDAVAIGTPVLIQPGRTTGVDEDVFAAARKYRTPTLEIQSSVDNGPWVNNKAIYPLKGQNVLLKVDKLSGANIRWFQIVPDTTKIYKNANFPWDSDPYKWVGFAKIDYQRTELARFRGQWQIQPFDNQQSSKVRDERPSSFDNLQNTASTSRFYHEDAGSFWFQAEVENDGTVYRSPGIEDSDDRGLSPQVFRVSIRDGQGCLGYLTSFFNVPGLFGSVIYQSNNYIGVDCADVLMAAYGKWKNRPIEKNYNVAMLVDQLPKINEFEVLQGTPNKQLKWGGDIHPGDFIAVRYSGRRQYQHVGALFSDKNENGVLDADDLVIHAGPQPLHCSYLKDGHLDGHIVILRP